MAWAGPVNLLEEGPDGEVGPFFVVDADERDAGEADLPAGFRVEAVVDVERPGCPRPGPS